MLILMGSERCGRAAICTSSRLGPPFCDLLSFLAWPSSFFSSEICFSRALILFSPSSASAVDGLPLLLAFTGGFAVSPPSSASTLSSSPPLESVFASSGSASATLVRLAVPRDDRRRGPPSASSSFSAGTISWSVPFFALLRGDALGFSGAFFASWLVRLLFFEILPRTSAMTSSGSMSMSSSSCFATTSSACLTASAMLL
mmetsp:Transcript_9774/g.29712  ORF Transcript_9774/g.29712 Transcript_9774/m.29712 type:complete len:201 (+) Transcript_9774:2148-2750(+)